MQSNQPVSPLSIMSQQRRYEKYVEGTRDVTHDGGVEVQTQTVVRLVQESVDAVIRNIGTILAK